MARPWRTIGAVTGWHVAASVCYYAVYAATPFLRAEFGLSGFAVGTLLAGLALGYALFLLPIGAAIDVYGERRALAVGLAWLSTGAVAVTLAPSYPVLLVTVVLLGTAYGTATPGTNRAIFTRVPVERRNLAMGVKQVGPMAGSGLGALLVPGLVASGFTWRVGFLIAGGGGLLVAGGFLAAYPPRPGDGGETLALPNLRGLLENRSLRWLAVAGFCIGSIMYTTTGYTLLYVHEGAGIAVGLAGAVLAITQVAGGAGRVVSGWLGDRLPGSPVRRTIDILLAQAAVGTVLLAGVPVLGSRAAVVAGFALLGFFMLGLGGMYFSAVGALAPPDETGSASAGGQLVATLGGLVSPPVFGLLVDTAGYGAAWLFLAGLGAVAVAVLAMIVTFGGDEGF